MLGGLAALFRWKALAKAAGIDIYSSHRPNLVITSGYQVCWEKFCRYWDIEMRLVPMEADHLYMTAEDAMKYVDDHTICVVCLLGITYTGRYDDVKGVDAALTEYNKTAKVPVRIHVDGASGAMVAPFIEPDLDWTSSSLMFGPSVLLAISMVWCIRALAGFAGVARKLCLRI